MSAVGLLEIGEYRYIKAINITIDFPRKRMKTFY